MTNPTHTPGPWLYRPEEYDDWGMVRAAPDLEGRMAVICHARNPSVGYGDLDKYRESRTDPYEANARLIAAAPELLEALKRVADAYGFDPSIDSSIWQDVFAAITKAEG